VKSITEYLGSLKAGNVLSITAGWVPRNLYSVCGGELSDSQGREVSRSE
jgi:uncharacterized protein (DUF2249 family)